MSTYLSGNGGHQRILVWDVTFNATNTLKEDARNCREMDDALISHPPKRFRQVTRGKLYRSPSKLIAFFGGYYTSKLPSQKSGSLPVKTGILVGGCAFYNLLGATIKLDSQKKGGGSRLKTDGFFICDFLKWTPKSLVKPNRNHQLWGPRCSESVI